MIVKFFVSTILMKRIVATFGVILGIGFQSVSAQDQTITITEIDFIGNSLVEDVDLNKRFNTYFNRELTLNEINELVSSVGFAYREFGYWAAAYLPEQTITGTSLKIGIIEAKTGEFKTEFETERSQLTHNDLFEIIMRNQISGAPMDIKSLEYGIKRANDIPGVYVAAELKEGGVDNYTDVKAYVIDSPLLVGSVILDNHLGGDKPGRLGVRLGFDSPFGYGEQFNLNFEKSYQTQALSLTSSIGVWEERARAGVELGLNEYKIGGGLADLGLKGDVKTVTFRLAEIDINPGNVDSPKLELSYSRSTSEDYALGVKTGSKTHNIAGLKLDWPMLKNQEDSSFLNLQLIGSIGSVDYDVGSDIYLRDQLSQKAHGDFAKLNFGLTGQKTFSETNLASFELNAQVASKNLDGSQKLSMSGPTSLQSLNPGDFSADIGIWSKLKVVHNFEQGSQIFGLLEGGSGYLNHDLWANWNGGNAEIKNSVYAVGAGLGVSIPINDKFDIELIAAKSIYTNLSSVSGDPNYWVELSYNF